MKERKKVLFIIDNWIVGGREKSVKTLIENLSDEWEKELLLLRNVRIAVSEEGATRFSFPQNTKVSRIEEVSFLSILLTLVRFLRKSSPDIISTHILPTGFLLSSIFFCKKNCLSLRTHHRNHSRCIFGVPKGKL